MSGVKVNRSKVRDPLEFDTHLYDIGVDCRDWDEAGGPRNDGMAAHEPLPSMTKQEFAEECDINTIMRRYETTGQIDHVNRRQPQYGDFASSVSFHEAMNTVIAAEDMFAALPASIRDRFGNDPENLLKFLDDPANKDEAIELGIVRAAEPEAPPQRVEIVNPAAPPPPPPPPDAP